METKGIFYGGEWHRTDKTRMIINPATGEDLMLVSEAGKEDVEKAIKAARDSFDSGIWSRIPQAARTAVMLKTAELLDENAELIDKLEGDNSGKLYAFSAGEAAGAASSFRYYAGIVGSVHGETYSQSDEGFVMTIKRPLGVCASIIPWNYPLFTTISHIAPALAAGNSVVIKPASLTPCTAIVLVELMEKAGFPAGVINLVTGSGAAIGDVIAESPDVDMIVLTGGTETGRHVMSKAALTIKKLALELGGKSPVIAFEDCDVDLVADNVAAGILMNQGQLCTACSRLIAHEKIYDEIIENIAGRFKSVRFGHGANPEANQCTLISREHMEKVLAYIEKGKAEGARLVCGGNRVTDGELEKGFFVAPTLFADVTADMTIVREEIFGPVLIVEKFTTTQEAIALANDTIYGLAGGVYTNDFSKAQQVIRDMRCSTMSVNTYLAGIADAPLHAVKQSGTGAIGGLRGLDEFMETRQINICLAPFRFEMI